MSDKILHNAALNPNVSVDCVIFGFSDDELNVLLIDRGSSEGNNGNKKEMQLPGHLVRDDEDLDTSARRVLRELTGLDNIYMDQFRAFGDPNRVKKEDDAAWLKSLRDRPDARVITVAYYSLVKMENYKPTPAGFARKAEWYPVVEVPDLTFDHNDILAKALETLKGQLRNMPIGFELLPKKFTLGQLQKLYETILGQGLDKRNFRRKILAKGYLIPLEEKQRGVAHKPAQYYQFDSKRYEELREESFGFEF